MLGVPGIEMIQKRHPPLRPPAPGEEELGLGEDPGMGRKRMQSPNKASFVQFSSLFNLVS